MCTGEREGAAEVEETSNTTDGRCGATFGDEGHGVAWECLLRPGHAGPHDNPGIALLAEDATPRPERSGGRHPAASDGRAPSAELIARGSAASDGRTIGAVIGAAVGELEPWAAFGLSLMGASATCDAPVVVGEAPGSCDLVTERCHLPSGHDGHHAGASALWDVAVAESVAAAPPWPAPAALSPPGPRCEARFAADDSMRCVLPTGHQGDHHDGVLPWSGYATPTALALCDQEGGFLGEGVPRRCWLPIGHEGEHSFGGAAPACIVQDPDTGARCELDHGHQRLHHAPIRDDLGEVIGAHGWSDNPPAGAWPDADDFPSDVEIAATMLSDSARELERAHVQVRKARARATVVEARVTELEVEVQRLTRERDTSAEACASARLEADELRTGNKQLAAKIRALATANDELGQKLRGVQFVEKVRGGGR